MSVRVCDRPLPENLENKNHAQVWTEQDYSRAMLLHVRSSHLTMQCIHYGFLDSKVEKGVSITHKLCIPCQLTVKCRE